MSTVRCPQCSAAVAAGTAHCTRCGYPLRWQDEAGDPTDTQAGDMARLPGEAVQGDQTTSLSRQPADEPADAGQRPTAAEASGPSITCPSCGAVSPPGRTLCQRCGMGLDLVDENRVVHGGRSWRGARAGWLVLLAVVVLSGAGLAWFMWSGRDDRAQAEDPQEPAAEAEEEGGTTTDGAAAPSPAPEVVIEEGDRGATVQQWQELVRAAGLDVQVDGQFGPQTARATRRFQATIGEEPTGQVTTVTMAAGQRASSLRVVDVFLLRDGELHSVQRRVDETQLALGALRALLDAPLQAERDGGIRSAVPAETTIDNVEVDGGIAAIALTGFGADPDRETMHQRVDQVVATLTQFGSVDSVRFELSEGEMEAFQQAGVPVTEPVRGPDG